MQAVPAAAVGEQPRLTTSYADHARRISTSPVAVPLATAETASVALVQSSPSQVGALSMKYRRDTSSTWARPPSPAEAPEAVTAAATPTTASGTVPGNEALSPLGWRGEYYNNTTLSGAAGLTRLDAAPLAFSVGGVAGAGDQRRLLLGAVDDDGGPAGGDVRLLGAAR